MGMDIVSEKIFNISGDILYDRYCTLVYETALKITSDKKNAEEVLVGTFRKLYEQLQGKKQDICLSQFSLMRTVIQTAREQMSLVMTGSGNMDNESKIANAPITDLKIDKLFCNCFGFGR
jgi:hypothetical protein